MTYISKKPRMKHQIEESLNLLKQDLKYRRIARFIELSPSERKQVERDSKRCRITYDLPKELIEAIDAVSKEYSASQSRVAALLMISGLEEISKGTIDIHSYCELSRSVRFENRINLPTIKPIYIRGKLIYPGKNKRRRSLPDKAEGDHNGDVGE